MLNVQPTARQQISSQSGDVTQVWYVWFDQVYKTIIGIFNSFQLTSLVGTTATTLGSSASSYVFSGVAETYTLPDMVKYKDKMFFIKNRGSGVLTVAAAGTDRIYTTASVASVAVAAGSSAILQSDGTYWNKI